jgi:mannonate dehydratase
MPRRRQVLMGLGACAALAGWTAWPEEGWTNPCLDGLPRALREHDIVRAAWDGISPHRVWDCHAHLVGTGDAGSGIWLNPAMYSPLSPLQYVQRLFFLNAGCADDPPQPVDHAYVSRLKVLLQDLPPGPKLMLMAFDRTYDVEGRPDPDGTAFHTPNAYTARTASSAPDLYEWIASVHPYRDDCVQELEWAADRGARAVKWLPPAMGIDPAAARCDRFYEACRRLGLPLLTHAGQERAVHGADRRNLGNPLRLRRALDQGVTVIVAHCATMGEDRDTDKGADGPVVPSFDLFARLMDDARYEGRLFGEISAVAQRNRAGPFLHRILQRTDWHSRLLNGSDYPLPGIMPLFSVDALAAQGFLDERSKAVLTALRAYNALLFDFVLKRELRSQGRRFPAEVFHTRDFFERDAAASGRGAADGEIDTPRALPQETH